MIYHQSLVIGGGLAGLRTAVGLNMRNVSTAVVSKVHPLRSHSLAAQGGINAALGNHHRGVADSPELHAFDTVKGSDYLADQNVAMRMCQDAPARIYEMEHWGCPFNRGMDGKIAQRPFGGAGFPRTCYASDKTGHALLHTLYEQATRFKIGAERGQLKFYDEWMVTRLIVEEETCRGVVVMNLHTGQMEAMLADAVIFATGGSGRTYNNSTNALISTGLGVAIPYWAGVPLRDMEFVQFHPTTLLGCNILMTEGARGEGGYLVNKDGDRFLVNYDDSSKAMEVAPRDIVARNIQREIRAGRGFNDAYVHLDVRHLGAEKIMKALPGIRDISIKFADVDPIVAPIPVQPGQHYTMGGIDCDLNGATRFKGFYAVGECSGNAVHGANRLGGNSLLDTVVFGAIVADAAADYVMGLAKTRQGEAAAKEQFKKETRRLEAIFQCEGKERAANLKEEMGLVMREKVGIFREKKALAEALEELKKLKERWRSIDLRYRGRGMNQELMWALELEGNLAAAEVIVAGALMREESRGSHFREDFPTRNDKTWLKHTVAKFTQEGPELSYAKVNLDHFTPKERKY